MEIEYSIESGVVPFKLENVVAAMTNVDEWASALSNIVHHRTDEVPSGVMSNLACDTPPHTRDNFKGVKTINAELLSPIPCVPTRKFSFVRFLRQVIPDIWAVVDVSTDYFPHIDATLEVNCKRRPSGVIIRRRDDYSEVIWIENMEVQKCNVQDSIYYGVFNSKLAFGAKRWVSTLSTKEKQIESRFVTLRLPIVSQAHVALLTLTRRLKVYLNYISEHPDGTKWDLLSDKGVRILKDTDAEGKDNYMAVTTFRVEATPCSVFNFLVKRTRELQWPNLEELEEPEEVIKLVTDDDSTCITLHAKSVMQTESTENFEYVLQEASRDEFCSFITASPFSQSALNSATLPCPNDPSLFQEDGSVAGEANSFLVFSIVKLHEQRFFIAPIDRGNPSTTVLATPLISFYLDDSFDRCYVGQCAGGLFLFSSASNRLYVNNDRLWLFYPPRNLLLPLPSVPHTVPNNILMISYFLGCTTDGVYKVLGIEWRIIGDDERECTMKIKTVRENFAWTGESEVWRRVTAPLDLEYDNKWVIFSAEVCVQLEGCIHWLFEEEKSIVAFAVDSEEFRLMDTPLPNDGHILGSLFEIGGRLAIMAVLLDHWTVGMWTLSDYWTDQWIHETIDVGFITQDMDLGFGVPEAVSNHYDDFVMVRSSTSPDQIWVTVCLRDSGIQKRIRVQPNGWVPIEEGIVEYFSTYRDLMH